MGSEASRRADKILQERQLLILCSTDLILDYDK